MPKEDMPTPWERNKMAAIGALVAQEKTNLESDKASRVTTGPGTMIPREGTIWLHHNDDKPVKILMITNEHADPFNRDKYPITVSYMDASGCKWSRPLWLFAKTYRQTQL